ncbi:glycosyl transferase family 2 [Kineococcus xinjiangensis]|uniref:Glucosyl-3-phosphoglycerate synthase n=1 Tax=Kineococcus xinjiangensis TaxID=512762 RepID=A0A2S6IDT5_9ACTN|nr:glycosyltransferase [Kineococcus xinjiangensis]PPK92357.1 glycosyl transferase family 2 [Kineococcus xinjiangensis]
MLPPDAQPDAQPVPAAAALPGRCAVVIPAKDEAERIAATVAAAATLEGVDLVVVVDDGSRDATAAVARDAGALVVRHPRNRGKAAAMETGARAVAEREGAEPVAAPRALLFVDADLGATAAQTAPLLGPVLAGEADMTIAVLPRQATAGGGRGLVVNLARKGTLAAVGWSPQQPLSGMRCLTRRAFEAARPLARGWGVETALTIDLLRAGHRVVEVPCELHHRVTGRDWRAQLHRGRQYRDVALALAARRWGRRAARP